MTLGRGLKQLNETSEESFFINGKMATRALV